MFFFEYNQPTILCQSKTVSACLSSFTGIFWKFVKVTFKVSPNQSFRLCASVVSQYVRMKTGQTEQNIIFLMRFCKISVLAL